MPFQNDIQNNTLIQSLTILFTKISHVQKGKDMHMEGYILIRRNLLYDSALHDLVFLPVYSKPAHR